jgi:hypothetical protein
VPPNSKTVPARAWAKILKVTSVRTQDTKHAGELVSNSGKG